MFLKLLLQQKGLLTYFLTGDGITYILEAQVARVTFLFGEEGWNERSGPSSLLFLKEDLVFCEVSLPLGDLGQVQICTCVQQQRIPEYM